MGALDGVPVAIKDAYPTRGWPTRRGSRTIDPAGPWERGRPRGRGAAAQRRGAARADDVAGVRLEGRDRLAAVRDHPQPVGSGDDAGRLERRQRGGARRGPRAAGARQRRRGLDPDPVRLHRPARVEADLRARAVLARERVRHRLPRRADGAHRDRRRAAARRDVRARPARLDRARRRPRAATSKGSTTGSPASASRSARTSATSTASTPRSPPRSSAPPKRSPSSARTSSAPIPASRDPRDMQQTLWWATCAKLAAGVADPAVLDPGFAAARRARPRDHRSPTTWPRRGARARSAPA